MTGVLIIDGVDVYSAFGVSLLEGSYAGLVCWPPLVEPVINDWPDEDGIEVDLESPKLDSKTFTMNFSSKDVFGRSKFLEMLSSTSYHEFSFGELGIVRRLRMVVQPSFEELQGMSLFSLDFVDDFPLDGIGNPLPVPLGVAYQGLEIDGVDISHFGVRMLDGCIKEIEKLPSVKENLLVKTHNLCGSIYDGEYVYFKSKEVTLNFLLTAPTIHTFWNNYHSFLCHLTRSGERILYVDRSVSEYKCYYLCGSVSDFAIDDRVWCEFSVTLVFTSFRAKDYDILLTTESGDLIITEDGLFGIDLEGIGYGNS